MKSTTWISLLFLILLVTLGISLPNPFYLDDFSILRDNTLLTSTFPKGGWFSDYFFDAYQTFPGFRPIFMWSYWMNAQILGNSPWSFRIGNILLHLGNGFLLYYFLTLKLSTKEKWVAMICALLFLVHPTQTLGINFLWKRSTLLETFW